jgi:hypothetical protein
MSPPAPPYRSPLQVDLPEAIEAFNRANQERFQREMAAIREFAETSQFWNQTLLDELEKVLAHNQAIRSRILAKLRAVEIIDDEKITVLSPQRGRFD